MAGINEEEDYLNQLLANAMAQDSKFEDDNQIGDNLLGNYQEAVGGLQDNSVENFELFSNMGSDDKSSDFLDDLSSGVMHNRADDLVLSDDPDSFDNPDSDFFNELKGIVDGEPNTGADAVGSDFDDILALDEGISFSDIPNENTEAPLTSEELARISSMESGGQMPNEAGEPADGGKKGKSKEKKSKKAKKEKKVKESRKRTGKTKEDGAESVETASGAVSTETDMEDAISTDIVLDDRISMDEILEGDTAAVGLAGENAQEESDSKGKKTKKSKERKAKKDKVKKDKEDKKFSLKNFFLEEDEEDTTADANQQLIDELYEGKSSLAEVDPKNMDDPSKKKKDKKEKTPKEKKEKPKKEPKPKKVKEPKEKAPKGKMDVGAVFKAVLIAAAVAAVIFFGSKFFSYYSSVKSAKEYFDTGNYTAAYKSISGLDIMEKDNDLYMKIHAVMVVYQGIESYNNYIALDDVPRAIDALVMAVGRKNRNEREAIEYDVTTQVDSVYNRVLQLLSQYGISEEKALEYFTMSDYDEYFAILEGIGGHKVDSDN